MAYKNLAAGYTKRVATLVVGSHGLWLGRAGLGKAWNALSETGGRRFFYDAATIDPASVQPPVNWRSIVGVISRLSSSFIHNCPDSSHGITVEAQAGEV